MSVDPEAVERRDAEVPPRPVTLSGIPASPGIAMGTITALAEPELDVAAHPIAEDDVEQEIDRFREAIAEVTREISGVRDAMIHELGAEGAQIFEAQLMILKDPLVIDHTEREVRSQLRNAEYLFRQNMLRVLERFDAMQGGLFKERAADIRDVKYRVLRRLTGTPGLAHVGGSGDIVVARELTPSETVMLSSTSALGLATERGGATSHAAIMARARRLPAVMGVAGLLEHATPGRRAILDGWRGRLFLDPTEADERRLHLIQEHYLELMQRLELLRELPSVTRDGREVHLHANIEMPMEMDAVHENGASGVGLFRTEFFLITRARLPVEDEQFEAYRQAIEQVAPKPVVFRTMDLGGDKFPSYIGADRERNPFLGLRGIRFLLGHEDVLRGQLRAILRASAYGPVRILFPMISTPEELRLARAHVDAVQEELSTAGVPFDRHVPIGVMIETPAAVLMADVLARECDFFSIGSNDLTQYALAVDRTNARLAYLFNSLHPSVLRAVRGAVHAAHREGCWVSLCGEMASDPLATVLLVGLGLDDLSMSPALIPEIKQLVRAISFEEAHDIATRAVRLSTAEEVETLVKEFMKARFPELVEVKGW